MDLHLDFLRWKSKLGKSTEREDLLFSRRQFLQGGAAVAAFSHDFARMLLGRRVEFRRYADAASFWLDGIEQWKISAEPFVTHGGGLAIDDTRRGTIIARLSGLQYAGTSISADLELRVEQRGLGWLLNLSLPQLGVERYVDLVRWLEGEPITWKVPEGRNIVAVSGLVKVDARGPQTMSLDRDWKLRTDGDLAVSFRGDQQYLRNANLLLQPATYSEEIPLVLHDGPSTRISLASEKPTWDISVAELLRAPVVHVPPNQRVFDRMRIDAWASDGSQPRAAASFLAAEDGEVDGTLHGEMVDAANNPVQLRLRRASYTVAVSEGREDSVFLSSLHEPTTAHGGSHSIVFDGQLEIQHSTASPHGTKATLGAKQVRVDTFGVQDGSIVEFDLPEGYRVPALHLDHNVGVLEGAWDATIDGLISIFEHDRFQISLRGVGLRVFRPSDMLALQFECDGLLLKMHGGLPFLEREVVSKVSATPYLKVTFPSQSLQEDCFFEGTNGQTDTNHAPATPVQTSAAGASWLRFRIPAQLFKKKRLPFTLETLLGWDQFTFLPGERKRAMKGSLLEVPYRLFLTPDSTVAFQHDVEPRTLVPTYTPDLQPATERAPELWSTLLHEAANKTEAGYDLEPIAMTAFGAADIAELIKIQVTARETVLAHLNQPISFGTPLPPEVFLYRGGTTPYLGKSAKVTLIGVMTNPDGTMIIEYKPTDVVLPVAMVSPRVPETPLWVLPQTISSQATVGCGGKPAPQQSFQDPVPNATQTGGVKLPPMNAGDRAQIVAITTGGTGKFSGAPANTQATPLNVNRLQLTALGAYFDTDSNFDDLTVAEMDANIEVRAWRHVMVLGRDSFVEVKYAGFLWPTGHKAQYVKRTQRVFYSVAPLDPAKDETKLYCYLRQQDFVQVKQKSRNYYGPIDSTLTNPPPNNPTFDLPFQQVDILTTITPALADPDQAMVAAAPWIYPANSCTEWEAFVPQIYDENGHLTDFLFDVSGLDWASPPTPIPSKVSMIFVRRLANTCMDAGTAEGIATLYSQATAAGPRNLIPMQDQHVHFAASKTPGDTQQQVSSLSLQGELLPPASVAKDGVGIYAHFYPFMPSANVEISPVSMISGTKTTANVQFEPTSYSKYEFNDTANKGEIYLSIVDTPSLSFNGQHSGGLATPSIPLKSITRPKGAISLDLGGVQNIDAKSFFPPIGSDVFPKILGVIPLQDLLYAAGDAIPSPTDFTTDSIPNTLTSLVNGAAIICQQVQSFYTDYYTPLSTALQMLTSLRGVTLKAVLAQLTPVVQQQVNAALQPQLNAAHAQAIAALQSAESNLDAQVAAAGGNAIAQQIKDAHDQLRQSIDTTLNNLIVAAISGILPALENATIGIDDLGQALDTVQETIDDARQSGTAVIANLQALASNLNNFANDPNLKNVTANSPDPLGSFVKFLKAQVGQDLTDIGNIALSLGIAVQGPLLEFDTDFDLAVDSATANFNTTFSQAVAALPNPTPNAAMQLEAARTTYVGVLTQSTNAINATVATAEETLAEAVGQAIGAATDAIVTAIFSDATTQVISDALTAIEMVNELVGEIDTLTQQLTSILSTPVSLGLSYTLPTLPLKDSGIFIGHSSDESNYAKLDLSVSISASASIDTIINKKAPQIDYQVIAQLQNFGIGLFSGDDDGSFISIYVQSMKFITQNQDHPKVDFVLDAGNPVIFGGALEYIDDLRKSFGTLGPNNCGPLISLTSDGIEIGWEFGLPDILAGGFTMTGVSFSFTVDMPFNGNPLALRFYFARPEKHFCISAGIYGGGGYLMLEGGPSASTPGNGATALIRAFQLCLEFGVTTGIDLGVATGDAKIMAGTYIGVANSICTLSGFVRAAGNLEIIELVNVALEIYVGVSYVQGGSIQGTGFVSLSISIGFFSIGVTVAMNWSWGGGGGGANGADAHLPATHGAAAPHLAAPVAARAVPNASTQATQATLATAAAAATPPPSLNYLTPETWKEYADAF